MKNIHVLPTNKPSRLIKNSNENKLYLCIQTLSIDEEIYCYPQHIYITSDEQLKLNDYYTIDGKEIYYCNTFNPSRNNNYKKIILTTDQDLIKDGVQAIDDDFLEWFVKNPSCEEVKVEGHIYKGQDETEYKILIPKEEPKQDFYKIGDFHKNCDEEYKETPIRECELLSYDDNKYCYVKVEGIEKEIKRCYIYSQRGRCGEVDCISVDEIKELLKEESKQETLEDSAVKYAVDVNVKMGVHKEAYENCSRLDFIAGAKWQQKQMYSEDQVKQAITNFYMNDFLLTEKNLTKVINDLKQQ